MKQEKPLRCPICGSKARTQKIAHDDIYDKLCISCENDDCILFIGDAWSFTNKEAVSSWNKRVKKYSIINKYGHLRDKNKFDLIQIINDLYDELDTVKRMTICKLIIKNK